MELATTMMSPSHPRNLKSKWPIKLVEVLCQCKKDINPRSSRRFVLNDHRRVPLPKGFRNIEPHATALLSGRNHRLIFIKQRFLERESVASS